MGKRGFTLIELVVVIAILAILATLGSKGIRSARINAKKAQAMVEMKSIETAIKAYQSKYGKLPVPDALQGQSEPQSDAAFSMDTIAVLTAEDLSINPAEMVFLEPQGVSTNGVFLDPWGEQYLLFLDTDYNNEVQVDCEGISETVRRKVALVSVGLFLLNESTRTNDLVKSWE
jgi:prepilin-type N-terminal cleavage/methylation domain-containing protein